jgi:hypothetical protein
MGEGWVSEDPATGGNLGIYCNDTGSEDYRIPVGAFEGEGFPVLEVKRRSWGAGTVVLVVPVARVHRRYMKRFAAAVERAWGYSSGPFDDYFIEFVSDEDQNGPGWARNEGVRRWPDVEWFLFVDADDFVKRHVFEAMNLSGGGYDSVWGLTEVRRRALERSPVMMHYNAAVFSDPPWSESLLLGANGGGGRFMGMFVRSTLARKIKWLEDMEVYEDLEFFTMLRAHGTSQVLEFPIVTVDELSVSAVKDTGVGMDRQWRSIVRFWQRHGQEPLEPEILAFRNETLSAGGFYGS